MLDGNISKLGYREGSDFEMREYEKITPFIKKIKNYEKYFNVQATSCEPDVLSTSDLIGFNDVCQNFKRDSITASNVNANLDKLRAINMPDLGMDLKGWMDKIPLDAQRVRQLNDHISELLLHAVVPMNEQGVMHNDLKSENLMMDRADDNLRIIDWGLAGITTPHQIIPGRYFMNNPVTFNRPFSTMIISSEIDDQYRAFIRGLPANFSAEDLKPFVSGLYAEYRKLAPTGHEYLTYIFETMFNVNTDAAGILLNTVVEKYNAEIMHHYTRRRQFMLHEYFDKVYRHNTDVWGTVSVYYSIFMLPRDHFIMPDSVYHDMLQRYRSIFRTMVFVNGHKRMNVQRIAQQLRQISDAVTGRFNKVNTFNKFNKVNPFNKFNKFNKSVKKMVRFNIDTDADNVHKKTHNYRVPTPYPFKTKT
jgi:thiamine kinase-like enzyme